MIGWRYTLTDGAWHSSDPSSSGVEGVAPSYLAAKKAILRDLREKFPRSGEARVSVQGREPGITYFEITGPQYAGVGALMEMEAEDVAQLVSGWGAEPAPLSQANPRARDNLLVATAAALVGVPAAQATAAVVGRAIAVNLGRAAYVAFLKMTPDERAEWMETQGTRFAWFRKPFQRFINEDRQSRRQTRRRKLYKGVARAFDNKKVQAAIEKGIAKEESKTRKNPQARDPRARDNFFWGKSEKTASKPSTPRLSYVQSMHLAEAMAADAKQRLGLRHGWQGYFLIKMPTVRGSGHQWFYLGHPTAREMGRASVYGAPQTKITASNPWATVLRNLDAIRDPSDYQIVELDTLTGKVTGPLSYSSVEAKAGIKGNPKKRKRKATTKAKRRNVAHEDALSRKTTRGHKRKERKRNVAKGHSRKPKHKAQAELNPQGDIWKELIYKNGELHETVYWNSLRDFWRKIDAAVRESGDPEGNQQIDENWVYRGSRSATTSYDDEAGNNWDLLFSRVPVRKNGPGAIRRENKARAEDAREAAAAAEALRQLIAQQGPLEPSEIRIWAQEQGIGKGILSRVLRELRREGVLDIDLHGARRWGAGSAFKSKGKWVKRDGKWVAKKNPSRRQRDSRGRFV